MLFSIRTAINKLLDIELDISVLYNYSNLKDLTNYIIETEFNKNEIVEEDRKNEADTDTLLQELEQLIDS